MILKRYSGRSYLNDIFVRTNSKANTQGKKSNHFWATSFGRYWNVVSLNRNFGRSLSLYLYTPASYFYHKTSTQIITKHPPKNFFDHQPPFLFFLPLYNRESTKNQWSPGCPFAFLMLILYKSPFQFVHTNQSRIARIFEGSKILRWAFHS